MLENEDRSAIVAEELTGEQPTGVDSAEEISATQPTEASEPEYDREEIAQAILKDPDLPTEDFERMTSDPAYRDELVNAHIEAEKKEKSGATRAGKEGKAKTEGESETPEAREEKTRKAKGGGWQYRVDRLTQRNYDLEASLAETRSRLRKLESAQAKTSASVQPPATPGADAEEPKEENFSDDRAYQDARTRWISRQEAKTAADELRAEQAEAMEAVKHNEAQKILDADWTEQYQAAAQNHADFEDVTEGIGDAVSGQPGVRKLRDDIAVALIHTGHAGEILYWLGKNPGRYDQLSELPSIAAAVNVARIAARLFPTDSDGEPLQNKKPKVSNAPPPGRRFGGANNQGAKDHSYYRDPNRCGIAELEKKLTGV